jgi:copper resistance protein B
MKREILFLSAFVMAVHVGRALSAEDHSAHESEHAQHQHDAGQEAPAATNEHAQHRGQASQEPAESELRHVPPAPPQLALPHLSNQAMIELMEMDDTAAFSKVLLDELEWQRMDDRSALSWDAQAWYGGDYNKLWLKTEGERVAGEEAGTTELLWDRVIARWWDVQAGVRHDFSDGPSRTGAAFGVQGLAPYWFEVEATAYVGDAGRSAARLVGEYELLLTQRWVLQPKIELNLYGKEDAANRIGSGLANADVGLRLRYEIRREFAPYVGVIWTRRFGGSADFAREAGEEVSDAQFVAGLRVWF